MNRRKVIFLIFCGDFLGDSSKLPKKSIIDNFRYLLTTKNIYNQFSKTTVDFQI